MDLPKLTPIRKLAIYKSTKTNLKPVVQVKRIEKMERHKYKLLLSDGSECHSAYVDCTLKKSKQLEEGSIVRLVEYLRTSVDNVTTLIKILDLDVIPDIMVLDLTLRPIRELKTYDSTMTNPNPVFQVIEVKKTERNKYKLMLSDGFHFHEAYADFWLEKGSIVRLVEYLRMSVDNVTTVIKVLDLNVIRTQCDIIGHPKPFPYSATPTVEDGYHDSLLPDEHPVLEGSSSAAPLVEDYYDMSDCLEMSELECGTETEDGFIML